MVLILVQCIYCRKHYNKDLRRVKESVKRNWKPYCSLRCLSRDRTIKILLNCSNPSCNKKIYKAPAELNKIIKPYCSQSCAAIINNKNSAVAKYCANIKCKKQFFGINKYCSISCVPSKESMYTKFNIIDIFQ